MAASSSSFSSSSNRMEEDAPSFFSASSNLMEEDSTSSSSSSSSSIPPNPLRERNARQRLGQLAGMSGLNNLFNKYLDNASLIKFRGASGLFRENTYQIGPGLRWILLVIRAYDMLARLFSSQAYRDLYARLRGFLPQDPSFSIHRNMPSGLIERAIGKDDPSSEEERAFQQGYYDLLTAIMAPNLPDYFLSDELHVYTRLDHKRIKHILDHAFQNYVMDATDLIPDVVGIIRGLAAVGAKKEPEEQVKILADSNLFWENRSLTNGNLADGFLVLNMLFEEITTVKLSLERKIEKRMRERFLMTSWEDHRTQVLLPWVFDRPADYPDDFEVLAYALTSNKPTSFPTNPLINNEAFLKSIKDMLQALDWTRDLVWVYGKNKYPWQDADIAHLIAESATTTPTGAETVQLNNPNCEALREYIKAFLKQQRRYYNTFNIVTRFMLVMEQIHGTHRTTGKVELNETSSEIRKKQIPDLHMTLLPRKIIPVTANQVFNEVIDQGALQVSNALEEVLLALRVTALNTTFLSKTDQRTHRFSFQRIHYEEPISDEEKVPAEEKGKVPDEEKGKASEVESRRTRIPFYNTEIMGDAYTNLKKYFSILRNNKETENIISVLNPSLGPVMEGYFDFNSTVKGRGKLEEGLMRMKRSDLKDLHKAVKAVVRFHKGLSYKK